MIVSTNSPKLSVSFGNDIVVTPVDIPKLTVVFGPDALSASANPPELDVSIDAEKLTVLTGTQIARQYMVPPYEGEYVVTPRTDGPVILETTGKRMEDDVTVNPIPSNYGLITWDGASLTVS